MRVKRILVHVNKVLTMITGALVFLLISIPLFTDRKRKAIRIPLAVNVVVLTVILLIIAAYGGAFDKRQDRDRAVHSLIFPENA
ncbi:MAG TPA: hypothetical protein VGD31_17475 [Sphingobacteriaceae bacterium]